MTRYGTYGYDATGKAMLTERSGGVEHFGFVYDSDTQTTVTDAVGNQELMTFQTQFGLKRLTSLLNQSDNKTLTQTFDAQNNLVCRQDEEGRVTTWTWNATNQKTSMTEGQTGSCAAPQTTSVTRTTSYQYLSTSLDLPTLIQSPSVRAGQQQATAIQYTDTAHPNLPTVITHSGYTPDGDSVSRAVSVQYNAQGQVDQVDGPRTDVSDLTTLAYNECISGIGCGQLASLSNALGQVTTFDSYDGNGGLTQMTNPNGLHTSYQYDPRGRVLFITQTPPTGNARTTEYRYVAAGDVTFTAFPDGITLGYQYDAVSASARAGLQDAG
ncbi:MAG: hypothetical protein ACREXS_01520 [Gammaproteobacteria bacterium]